MKISQEWTLFIQGFTEKPNTYKFTEDSITIRPGALMNGSATFKNEEDLFLTMVTILADDVHGIYMGVGYVNFCTETGMPLNTVF